jgi:hypothetical protein
MDPWNAFTGRTNPTGSHRKSATMVAGWGKKDGVKRAGDSESVNSSGTLTAFDNFAREAVN